MLVSINMHANTHCEVLVCIAIQWVLKYIFISMSMLLLSICKQCCLVYTCSGEGTSMRYLLGDGDGRFHVLRLGENGL